MDTFDEWVKNVQYPCIQEWGEKVVGLGASWDSFRRDDKQQITNDLVEGGIPILAARDIVDIAAAEVKKSTAPMAIFWDLENMPIPDAFSGRDMTRVLKNILTPHGDLIQFRGYASIGLNLIPQEKRSDLQLSGCHLVDCPHHGRKEVADKMIIVDAMHFAYQHPDGATLCFIAGDVDYAYLLAVLQQRPQWRTIVISRGTMQSMLHVNCDMKIRWETDILKTIYSTRQEIINNELKNNDDDDDGDRIDDDDDDEDDEDNKQDGQDELPRDDEGRRNKNREQFAPLTADEFWKDDVELLRNVIVQAGQRSGTRTPLKSLVGNMLRETNPARFPNRSAVKTFFAQAIDKRVVVEQGNGAFKTIGLVDTLCKNAWLTVSTSSPIPADEIPARALDIVSKGRPFIIFIQTWHCPSGFSPPDKAFTQSVDGWLLFLYASYSDVQQSVLGSPWLRNGTVVDWRQVSTTVSSKVPTICSICDAHCSTEDLNKFACKGKLCCSPECIKWSDLDNNTKAKAVGRVIETLKFLASNDDIYTNQNLLYKLIESRYREECPSRKYARLWVKEAIRSGKAIFIKFAASKNKNVCLLEYANKALTADASSPTVLDTAAEEKFVLDLLWEEGRPDGLDRRHIAQKLQLSFDTMKTPSQRNRILSNAQASGKLHIDKGPFSHNVGLTKKQAKASLEYEMNKMQQDKDVVQET